MRIHRSILITTHTHPSQIVPDETVVLARPPSCARAIVCYYLFHQVCGGVSVWESLTFALFNDWKRETRCAVAISVLRLRTDAALVLKFIHLIPLSGVSRDAASRTPRDPPGRGSNGTAARPWRYGVQCSPRSPRRRRPASRRPRS